MAHTQGGTLRKPPIGYGLRTAPRIRAVARRLDLCHEVRADQAGQVTVHRTGAKPDAAASSLPHGLQDAVAVAVAFDEREEDVDGGGREGL